MEDYNVTKALKLITYEGYGADSYLDYLMACTVVNHYLAYPYKELYSNWGGGDGSYNEGTFANVGIADHAYWALREALLDLDPNAWDCHGIIPENGYSGGVQILSEAYYISYVFDIIYAVWPRDAGWY